MKGKRRYDVLIAGAGPAGLSTALHLLQRRPAMAGRIAIIEKSAHPRFKICAGGLIPRAISALNQLGIELSVPHFEVFGGIARTECGTIELAKSDNPHCTIIRRDQFDAMLARAARDAGVDLIERTRITKVGQENSIVTVETNWETFDAEVLVGADGTGSRVRREVFGDDTATLGRALMIDIPADEWSSIEFAQRIYRFDFNCVEARVAGYSWSFPCIIDDRDCLNVGIYDQGTFGEARPNTESLLIALAKAFPEIDIQRASRTRGWKVFPIKWYSRHDSYVSGRVILAGDAAGVDPLMGEGISYALEHGRIAAEALISFLDGNRTALENYRTQLHKGLIGRKLRRLAFAARRFYGPRHRLYFRMAAISREAQKLGIEWYNGVGGTDELSIPAGLLRLTRGILSSVRLR